MTSVANKKICVYDVPTIRTVIVAFSVHLGRLFSAVEGYAHISTVQSILMELLYYMHQISCLLDIHLECTIIQNVHLNKFQFVKDMSDQLSEDYDCDACKWWHATFGDCKAEVRDLQGGLFRRCGSMYPTYRTLY